MSLVLWRRFSLSPAQAGFGLTEFSTKKTVLGGECPAGGPCQAVTSPYNIIPVSPTLSAPKQYVVCGMSGPTGGGAVP